MIARYRRADRAGASRALSLHQSVAAAFAVLLAALLALPAQARPAPESFADLAEQLSPAVVNISTTQKVQGPGPGQGPGGGGGGQFEFQFPPGSPFEEFFKEFFERNRPGQRRGPARRVTSLGSGFIIDAQQGYIVTNNHVIAEADEIMVTLSDGNKLQAEVVGKDPKTDLALLKVENGIKVPQLKWGDSDISRVGDWVLAIGNPFGLGGSVTAGIISARSRDINAGPYDDFIQTDASINRGNSGGPLFNLDGEVIGINTAIFSPTGGSVGIGFAIPSALARNVIEQLAEYGRTRRGWLGVRIQTVTEEIAEGLGLNGVRGALVAGVTESGPAEAAGIAQGDVILEFDGKDVSEMRALPRIVAETRIGKEVGVVVWRKGERKDLKVTIAELEEAEEQQLAALDPKRPQSSMVVESMGMKLSAITDELRANFDLRPEAAGVVITSVKADSPAAQKGLRPGDVIVEVSQEEVSTPDQVVEKIEKVRGGNRRSVLLLVERGGDLRFVALKIGDEE